MGPYYIRQISDNATSNPFFQFFYFQYLRDVAKIVANTQHCIAQYYSQLGGGFHKGPIDDLK